MTPLSLLGLPWNQLLPIAAAGSAVLTVLYVLRQRRRRLEVPFSPLWQKVLGQSEAQSLWQKLLRVLSLLLQLVILGLLTLSLGDPRLGRSTEGRSLVLLIDASASMQAQVPLLPGKTRLDLARAEAEQIIRGLHGDDLAVERHGAYRARAQGRGKRGGPHVRDDRRRDERARRVRTLSAAACGARHARARHAAS